MVKVVEIFKSIDGEGIRTGLPVTFIRLHGCNLRCSYCDTSYAYDNNDYQNMSVETILSIVENYGLSRITLTGGEPLYQKESIDLIASLLNAGFEVNIETNGSIDLYKVLGENLLNKNLIITMDWKCHSSKMSGKMLFKNLNVLRSQDVLKFVVGSTQDLDQMRDILSLNDLKCNIFVSPVFGKIDPQEIVNYVLRNNLKDVRVQLQIHKLIWNPEMRGV